VTSSDGRSKTKGWGLGWKVGKCIVNPVYEATIPTNNPAVGAGGINELRDMTLSNKLPVIDVILDIQERWQN